MEMKNQPYIGYFMFLRAMLLLFMDDKHGMNFDALGTYICFISDADWDPTHANYKLLKVTDKDLSKKLNVKSSTFWRKRKVLEKIGLICKHPSGKTEVKFMELIDKSTVGGIAKYPLSTKEELLSISGEVISEFKKNISDMKARQDQKRLQSFRVPFKGNLSSSDYELTDEDIEKIDKL